MVNKLDFYGLMAQSPHQILENTNLVNKMFIPKIIGKKIQDIVFLLIPIEKFVQGIAPSSSSRDQRRSSLSSLFPQRFFDKFP